MFLAGISCVTSGDSCLKRAGMTENNHFSDKRQLVILSASLILWDFVSLLLKFMI